MLDTIHDKSIAYFDTECTIELTSVPEKDLAIIKIIDKEGKELEAHVPAITLQTMLNWVTTE